MAKVNRLLVFHPTIAPYRIDFFNDLYSAFECRICLEYRNLKDQTFDYDIIERQFVFTPEYLPSGSIWDRLKCVWKIISGFAPDVVLTSEYGLITFVTLLYNALHLRKYRVVVISDDSYDMIALGHDFTAKHKIARALLAPQVDEVIVIEPRVRDLYQSKYGKGFFFPIIVDEEKAGTRYERIMPITRQFAQKYNLLGKRVILSVSRLVDLKNIDRVIDAYSRIDNDAVLVIVGDGPERDKLEEKAAEAGKQVIFTGRFDGDELYAWYNLASVFILASYLEPFGAVTNEALLAGCRSVVSCVAGSMCLINDANGELCDPLDIDSIRAALNRELAMAPVPDLEHARSSLMPMSYKDLMASLKNALRE